jgi:serine/tyrosine/threonine adenylyltransferase
MPVTQIYRAETAHVALGDAFYDEVEPARFPKTILRFRNNRVASRVGLDALSDEEWISHFAHFAPLPESLQKPLALRYHGHQFRSYNSELGDGRGFLFAQLRDAQDGRLLDLGTKGSGVTPWSRRGDGRLTLKGGMREILATEMLEALGVDTSRSFSLIETGEALQRNDEPSPTRASVLVRLSHSHIRIGTFQRFAHLEDNFALARLLDHAITHYYPELVDAPQDKRATMFFSSVCARVAKLGARYMAAGFVHGVLNSDNINITGESFDYGPWRFAPTHDPNFVAAYFDYSGLYSFGRQPGALHWNLERLAECLLPFMSLSAAQKALDRFGDDIRRNYREALLERLALSPADEAADSVLSKAVFGFLTASQAPFEQFFFDWRGGAASAARAKDSIAASHYTGEAFDAMLRAFEAHEPAPHARLDHAYFRRAEPCSMLIDEVESIWAPIAENDDWRAFEAKLKDIALMRDACRPETGSAAG